LSAGRKTETSAGDDSDVGRMAEKALNLREQIVNDPNLRPKSSQELVGSMEEVVRTLGTMEQVVRTILEDNDAKISRVSCYRVLQKYACNQVKIRTLEAKVKMLEEKLNSQTKFQSLEAKVKMLEDKIDGDTGGSILRTVSTDVFEEDLHTHHYLTQTQQDELDRKAQKLERLKRENAEREEANYALSSRAADESSSSTMEKAGHESLHEVETGMCIFYLIVSLG
jgi:hypothetical protein